MAAVSLAGEVQIRQACDRLENSHTEARRNKRETCRRHEQFGDTQKGSIWVYLKTWVDGMQRWEKATLVGIKAENN